MGCGASSSGPRLKQVVIIGGGYGGSYVAHFLSENSFCQVTLIDPKEAMIQTAALPRCIVEPDFLKNVFIPYDTFIENNHTRGTVTSINPKKKLVILEGGKKIPYDFLIICSGRNSPFPLSLSDVAPAASIDEAKKHYIAFNSDMKQSPDIVLIGRNEFAVELAGELRTDYPDKKVSIISDKKKLISDDAPEELHSALVKLLDRKEVDLFLETTVTNMESLVYSKHKKEQTVKTSKGKDIVADLIIKCDDFTYATNFCKSALPGSSFDTNGALKVDTYLKVENCTNIYALGDLVNLKCASRPENAKKQANVIAENIKAAVLLEGQLATFQAETLPTIVTFGSYDGAGFYDGELMDEDDKMITEKCFNFFVDDMLLEL